MKCSSWVRRLTTAALVAGCVTSVVVWGELSGGALLGVGLTGLVVVGMGLARRSGQGASPVGRRGLPWLGWLVAGLAWELVTLADEDLPTLSDLADPLLGRPAVRGAVTLCWLAAGAWLLARPRRRPPLT